MSRRVEVSSAATSDLIHYFLRAQADAPRTAERWLQRFKAKIATLASLPERFGVAPENKNAAIEVRQLLFGKGRGAFRVLFTIEETQIKVLRIVRASHDKNAPDDLFGDT